MEFKVFKKIVFVAFVAIFALFSANADDLQNISDIERKDLQEAKNQYDALLNVYFDISAEFFALTKRVDSSSTEAQGAIKNGMAEATKVGAIVKSVKDMESSLNLAHKKAQSAKTAKQSNYESLQNKYLALLKQYSLEIQQITNAIKKSTATLQKYE